MANQVTTLRMGQKFKRTPLGEIPVDWETTTFDASFEFVRSANNSRADLTATDEVGYLHYGDIHTKWRTKLDCNLVELPRIAKEKVKGIPRLKDGDIVIADASEDYEGVGAAVEIFNLNGREVVAGLHTIVLRDRGGRFAPGFRGYLQYIPAVRQRLMQVATGAAVYGLSKRNLSGIPIPRPPFAEQAMIAEVLSAIEAAIEKSNDFVRIMQILKQSLMCQLLSPGKDWDFLRLGDLGEIRTGGTPSPEEVKYWNGQYPFVTPADISERRDLRTTNRMATAEGLEIAGEIPAKAVLVTCTGFSIGKIGIASRTCCANQQINAVVCGERILPEFLYYILKKKNNEIRALAGKTVMPFINKSVFSDFEVPIPKIDVQTRIVEILSGIDDALDGEAESGLTNLKIRGDVMAMLLSGKVRPAADSFDSA